MKMHFTVQSSVTIKCVPSLQQKMQIMIMIKIMIIMKIMDYNEK